MYVHMYTLELRRRLCVWAIWACQRHPYLECLPVWWTGSKDAMDKHYLEVSVCACLILPFTHHKCLHHTPILCMAAHMYTSHFPHSPLFHLYVVILCVKTYILVSLCMKSVTISPTNSFELHHYTIAEQHIVCHWC